MLPKLGERFTSGPQLKVELLDKFSGVKPHNFNASNCHYSDRKRARSTYFNGVVLGGRNSSGLCVAGLRAFRNSLIDGKELGATSVRSGGCEPVFRAVASNRIASPIRGGETTVAASSPCRTHSWPERGTPSHPVRGRRSQASRSRISSDSSKARCAPIAMSSFWQAIIPMWSCLDVLNDSQDLMAWCPLFWVQSPFTVFTSTLPGFVESMPLVRNFATSPEGPSI